MGITLQVPILKEPKAQYNVEDDTYRFTFKKSVFEAYLKKLSEQTVFEGKYLKNKRMELSPQGVLVELYTELVPGNGNGNRWHAGLHDYYVYRDGLFETKSIIPPHICKWAGLVKRNISSAVQVAHSEYVNGVINRLMHPGRAVSPKEFIRWLECWAIVTDDSGTVDTTVEEANIDDGPKSAYFLPEPRPTGFDAIRAAPLKKKAAREYTYAMDEEVPVAQVVIIDEIQEE